MTRIGIEERRARLAVRHHLAKGAEAADPAGAAEGVVALHSTDPASVYLSVRARTGTATPAEIERALYEDRSLVRMLGMRRTMFVVPADVAPVIQAACTEDVAKRLRKTYTGFLVDAGVGDGAWLAEVEEETVRALATRGEATGAELAADVPRLRTRISMNEGKAYAATTNITTWVVLLLAAEGRIVRGRPRGSWISSQYRWAPMESWLPGGLRGRPTEAAREELVRRWLAAYGPGTVSDLRWWTGWTAAQVKKALAGIGAVEVGLDGATGLVLPGDEKPVADPGPWVAYLPALDPTPMGWSERSWYLGPHAETLFDRSGNVGPTVWCDGRIVGGWAQRADGSVEYRLLEKIGRTATAAVRATAADVASWIGPVRVTPRFRTPLERELTQGAS